jgi:hypothetical protein
MSYWKSNGSTHVIFADDQICGNHLEEPLRYEAITGLAEGQLTELTARVHEIVG